MDEDRLQRFFKQLGIGKYKTKNKTNHIQKSVKKNLNSVNTQEIEHEVDHAIESLTNAFSDRENIAFGWEFTDEQ